MLFVLAALVFLSVFLLVITISFQKETDIEARLRSIGFSDPAQLTPEEVELNKPFSERIIKPQMEKLSSIISKYTSGGVKAGMKRKIQQAGRSIPVQNFLMLRVFSTIGVPLTFGLLLFLGKLPTLQILIFVVVLFIFGYMGPGFWLNSQIKIRQKVIQRSLPDVLDLLCVSVEAGLGFDSAVSKVVDKMKGPITDEFHRMLQEVRMNKSRREALRDLSERVNLPDLSTFIASLVQADQLGVSIARVLRIQSEQMRIKRRLRAQEQAQKAAVKMVFPLVFFIFPAMFIVLLGPVVIQVIGTKP